jgi:hypothetical protein
VISQGAPRASRRSVHVIAPTMVRGDGENHRAVPLAPRERDRVLVVCYSGVPSVASDPPQVPPCQGRVALI